jgi:hypothetical protein
MFIPPKIDKPVLPFMTATTMSTSNNTSIISSLETVL